MKPFLGVWTQEAEDGFKSIMTFEVKDGLVHSQFAGIAPDGRTFELEINFVRVVDARTLQWGVRNGRGPGVEVHTAKLVDQDTLAGTVEEVGFIHQRPPHSFTYRRRVNANKSFPKNAPKETAQLLGVGLSRIELKSASLSDSTGEVECSHAYASCSKQNSVFEAKNHQRRIDKTSN